MRRPLLATPVRRPLLATTVRRVRDRGAEALAPARPILDRARPPPSPIAWIRLCSHAASSAHPNCPASVVNLGSANVYHDEIIYNNNVSVSCPAGYIGQLILLCSEETIVYGDCNECPPNSEPNYPDQSKCECQHEHYQVSDATTFQNIDKAGYNYYNEVYTGSIAGCAACPVSTMYGRRPTLSLF